MSEYISWAHLHGEYTDFFFFFFFFLRGCRCLVFLTMVKKATETRGHFYAHRTSWTNLWASLNANHFPQCSGSHTRAEVSWFSGLRNTKSVCESMSVADAVRWILWDENKEAGWDIISEKCAILTAVIPEILSIQSLHITPSIPNQIILPFHCHHLSLLPSFCISEDRARW